MDPDDRAYVVGLAEEVFGAAVRAHRWPFLVDEEGEPLEADAFWADHGVAFVVLTHPVERWRFAGLLLGLRDVRLLVVPADALPTGPDGRLRRADDEVRRALGASGMPGTADEVDAFLDRPVPVWVTSTVDLQGAYRTEDGSWVVAAEPGEDDEGRTDDDVEIWDGSGGADEPWIPAWNLERFEESPWGGKAGWDEERQAAIAARAGRDEDGDGEGAGPGRDDEDDAWDDEHGPGEPYVGEAPVELGWRSRPIALAALGAVVLARRVLAEHRTGDLPPTSLQVLAALAVPDDEAVLRDLSNARGLAARLALRESTVRGTLEDLVERGLVQSVGEPEEALELTRAGRTALLAWIERIAPLFGGWSPEREGPDDAV